MKDNLIEPAVNERGRIQFINRRIRQGLSFLSKAFGLDSQMVGIFVGALLVSLGVDAFIDQIFDNRFSVVPLGMGIGLLFAWSKTERWPYLFAGSLLFLGGAGALAGNALRPRWHHALLLVGLGAGFVLISVLSSNSRGWARISGGVLVALGIARAAVPDDLIVPNELSKLGFPLLVTGAGAVLIFRSRLPKLAFRSLLAAAAVVAIALPATRADRTFESFAMPSFSRQKDVRIPPLEGRSLVVEAGTSNVLIENGPSYAELAVSAQATTLGEAKRATTEADLVIEEREQELLLKPAAGSSHIFQTLLRLYVPSVPVTIRATSGTVSVRAALQSLHLEVESGRAVVVGTPLDLAIQNRSGRTVLALGSGVQKADVTTSSGDVEVAAAGDPSLAIQTGSGVIYGEGSLGVTGQQKFERKGTGGTIQILTGSGRVTIRRIGGTGIPTLSQLPGDEYE